MEQVFGCSDNDEVAPCLAMFHGRWTSSVSAVIGGFFASYFIRDHSDTMKVFSFLPAIVDRHLHIVMGSISEELESSSRSLMVYREMVGVLAQHYQAS